MSVGVIMSGVSLGFEIIKFLQEERRIKDLAAQAGLSPEALEELFQRGRKELSSLRDPKTLKEV